MPRSLSRRVASGPASPPLPPAPGSRWFVALTSDPDVEVVVCDSEEEAQEVWNDLKDSLESGLHAIMGRGDDEGDDDEDDY